MKRSAASTKRQLQKPHPADRPARSCGTRIRGTTEENNRNVAPGPPAKDLRQSVSQALGGFLQALLQRIHFLGKSFQLFFRQHACLGNFVRGTIGLADCSANTFRNFGESALRHFSLQIKAEQSYTSPLSPSIQDHRSDAIGTVSARGEPHFAS